jgi:hypothetical protein
LTQDEKNDVTLVEKNRKLCQESTGSVGNLFLPFNSTPATCVKFTSLLNSLYLINGPSVIYSTKVLFEPALAKFFWHFLLQGYASQQIQ